ncbi:TPA: energy-coupling factor transporter ATPase [bacterium]|nr:energy-coupling factor transporter ATPase [bacterium]
MIKIENLGYSYSQSGGVSALRRIDLEICEGEFIALIGPSGCGKTTLAKCLNGILTPSCGQVLIDGLNTASKEAKWTIRQQVGIVFAHSENQLIGGTVEEDIAFGLENIGMEPSLMRQRIDETLGLLSLEEYRDFPPHLLSDGQKQVVAIAGVLAFHPKYLVLDRATELLDPGAQRRVLEIVQRLNRKGMTILLITHSMEEIFLAQRVVVMDQGKKILEGEAKEIFAHPIVEGLGLSPPLSFRFITSLRQRGLDVSEDTMMSTEGVLKAICP